MTSVISKFVTSTLCDHQGCLDFKRLEETLAQHFTVEESLLRRVLLDHDKIAIQEGRQKVVGKVISPDSLVVAKTGLRICQKKPGECLQCDGLHLCRFYVCGNCTFGHKCKNPHSLTSPYNAEHLKRYGLHDLTEKQLFQLLLQNDPYLLPEGDSDTASVTSQTLENVYLADRETEIPFSAGKQQYVLYFKGAAGTQQMYQQNVKYKTKREVRRRPRFVSAQDVEVKLKSATSHSSSSSTAESCPSHWDKNALPDFGYRMVLLSKSAKEYNMIEKLFKNTMPQSTINSIKRIQNLSLWKVFQWQKEQMKVRNGGNSVNEQYLFHGTDESLIEAICEQNFDWRMCGVHGTAYGKGSYFARDASYSDRYAKIKGSLSKIMFVALVLVGDYTRGSSAYVRPPPKSNSKTLYDSCVDCESNPSIYVIFEKQQIYPEYVINYS